MVDGAARCGSHEGSVLRECERDRVQCPPIPVRGKAEGHYENGLGVQGYGQSAQEGAGAGGHRYNKQWGWMWVSCMLAATSSSVAGPSAEPDQCVGVHGRKLCLTAAVWGSTGVQ